MTALEMCEWAQSELRAGRVDRARRALEQAIILDPSSLPARFGLASICLQAGNLAAATKLAAQIYAAAPDRPDTLWLQMQLAQARQDDATAATILARLIRDPRLNKVQHAEAWLMLGVIREREAEYKEAFVAAEHGKKLQRQAFAAEAGRREGEVAKLHRVNRWLKCKSAGLELLALPPIPGAAATHVFLIGFPRSGTTLLEQIFAAHPDVATLEEEPLLAAAYEAFLSDDAACASLDNLKADEAAAWATHYWQKVRDHGLNVSGHVFIDKQPAGTLLLPIIARLFPEAKILFALRDPRDVVLSCYRQAFALNAMTYTFTDLAETAACYDACMAFAEAARERLPLAWLDVKHEALVEDFEGEIARILAFLGLSSHPAMRDFARAANTRTIRTPSAPQVRAGLNRLGIARWRQFASELAPVLPSLAPWVERFGYPD